MTAPHSPKEREKVVSKLPASLRQELKIRAAQLSMDIKDAVTEGVQTWRQHTGELPLVDTSGGSPFSTYLPIGLPAGLKADCEAKGISYAQGIAQAIRLWLDANKLTLRKSTTATCRRLAFANQKGGVGKTSTSAGVAQGLAEAGFTVCLIDYDPQCHLTRGLGQEYIPSGSPSLASHMVGEARGHNLADLLIPIEPEYFGDRLQLLPGCKDGFLLDAKLVTSNYARVKETALSKALAPLEERFDFIIIDCPPSLGYAMDNALYYVQRRDEELEGASGAYIPVLAEDSSADAYDMLTEQIDDLADDLGVTIDQLGFVVNLYDPRKGYIVTSSLEAWKAIEKPPVVAVLNDLSEQRKAVRLRRALLAYEPTSELAASMRALVRHILGESAR